MALEIVIISIVSYFSLLASIFFLLSLLERRKPRPRAKELPKVSVLIPAHNEENTIVGTLDSLFTLDYPKNKLEIIVVDDGSTDRTFQVVKNYGHGVKIFKKPGGGKGSALNFGIPKCTGELILTLDADCQVSKNSLKKMVGYFKDKRVIATVPTLKVLRKENFLERMQQIEYVLSSFIRKVLWFISAMYVVPGAPIYRATFLKANRFDEENLTEDLEMGLRIKAKGGEITHATDAVVYTFVPRNLKSLLNQRMRWTYGTLHNFLRYGFLFGLKHGDLSTFVLPLILVSIGLSFLLFVYLVGTSLVNFFNSLYFASLIGFDLKYLIFSFNIFRIAESLMDIRIYLSAVLILIGLLFYTFASRELKDELRLRYLLYILGYGWLLLLFNFLGVLAFSLRRKPKWSLS